MNELTPLTSLEKQSINDLFSLFEKAITNDKTINMNKLEKLDFAWNLVITNHQGIEKESLNTILLSIGVYLGTLFIDDFPFEWKKYSKEDLTEFCLQHQFKQITIFPISTILKKFEEKDNSSIDEFYKKMKMEISEKINCI